MQEYLEGLHEFLPIGKIVAACLWKVHLEELIWHQFFSANQLEVIRPPACFHATWSPLIVISSAAVDGPPLVHISDAGGDCLWNYFNEGYGSSVCTVTWPELYLKPLPHSGSRVSFTCGWESDWCRLCTLDCRLLNMKSSEDKQSSVSPRGFCPAHVHLLCTLYSEATGVDMRRGECSDNAVNRSYKAVEVNKWLREEFLTKTKGRFKRQPCPTIIDIQFLYLKVLILTPTCICRGAWFSNLIAEKQRNDCSEWDQWCSADILH